MTETVISVDSLLKARKGTVEFVDVPEFGFRRDDLTTDNPAVGMRT